MQPAARNAYLLEGVGGPGRGWGVGGWGRRGGGGASGPVGVAGGGLGDGGLGGEGGAKPPCLPKLLAPETLTLLTVGPTRSLQAVLRYLSTAGLGAGAGGGSGPPPLGAASETSARRGWGWRGSRPPPLGRT